MTNRWLSILGGLLIAITASACAVGGDPSERALRRSLEATSTALERGAQAADSVEDVPLVARHNPCRCPAPAFEIFTRGRWQRVIIDGDDQALEALLDDASEAATAGRLVTFDLWGRFNGEAEYDDQGIDYPRFVLERHGIK